MILIFFFILFFTFSIRLYTHVHQCIHTNHFDNKTTIFKETDIEKINIRVISGIVDIMFHSESYFEVNVKNKYRNENLIQRRNILSEVTLNQGALNIISETPAFNFNECLHSHITITLPYNYQKIISLHGIIKTGYVRIHGNKTTLLDRVDMVVEVGAIRIDNLSSKSIALSIDLGCIEVSKSIAIDSTKLLAHTGSIRSHGLVSNVVQAVTKYGGSYHAGLVAENVMVNTKWGYSRIYGAVSSTINHNIQIKTEYGKSVLALENNNIDFNLENQRGNMLVEYDSDIWDCKSHLETKYGQSMISMKGKCDILKKEKDFNSPVKVDLDTQYGNSILIVDQIEE